MDALFQAIIDHVPAPVVNPRIRSMEISQRWTTTASSA